MSVVVEFSMPGESFPFGRATRGGEDMQVQLERLIPLKQERIPFLWAIGEDFDQFERHLRESDAVKHVEAVFRRANSVLYYVEWYTDRESFLNGVCEAGGAILAAHGNAEWSFTIRFRDHQALTEFHQFYQSGEYPVAIERVYSPEESSRLTYGFGLTPEQRDVLMRAVKQGYFSVPRETDLGEIAEQVGISRQAASERVRRAAEKVLRQSLVGLTADALGPPTDGTEGEQQG
ncbi:helix-turn-helix domain-containing protein [Haloarcula onubensis]|uniref:Helix-turn-helix domain-containing protein n=1 Tax=Haloarcula onubensis TaxID=2950539 RepID=A0ABU2FR33_9EURY|nr:helix-turn-helix domain-containing protein [Halomicroarcula sp. S3CR25-11]MDS0283230.1 helix-turn-helix domain-containing protein [Halomicroarcula sp. S3CR25-11]